MPEKPVQPHPIPNPKSHSGVPWYESNLLWGGVGALLTVVGAMSHNLLWLLWFAWLCFLFLLWNRKREIQRFRALYLVVGIILVSGLLFGLKILLSPAPATAPSPMAAKPVTGPTPQTSPLQTNPQQILKQQQSIQHKQKAPAAPATKSVTPASTTANGRSSAEPTYQQNCEGSACAQGPGSQATYIQYGAPKLVMTDAQQIAIRDAMKSYAGKNVTVFCLKTTDDAILYADKMAQALQEARLNVNRASRVYTDVTYPNGVSFVASDDRRDEVTTLTDAMHIRDTATVRTSSVYGTLAVLITPNR